MKEKNQESPDSWEKEILNTKPLMERSNINRDTFLNCWCPKCKESLNEGDKAHFKITNKDGQTGISKMSPVLNVLDRETDMTVSDNEALADVQCPHCDTSLIVEGVKCKYDNCNMMGFDVSVAGSEKLKLIVCVLQTCRWYFMSEEDNDRLILRGSHEW